MNFRCIHRRATTSVIAFISLQLCAFAYANDIRWIEGAFASVETISPGKVAERCGDIDPREPVAWTFSADGVLDFNIHRHSGSDVIYTNRAYGTRMLSGTFKPTLKQQWCWMWKNETNAPVTVRIAMKRE